MYSWKWVIGLYLVFQILAILSVYFITWVVNRYQWSPNWICDEAWILNVFWLFMIEALCTELDFKAGVILVVVGELVTLLVTCWPARQHLINMIANLLAFCIGLALRSFRDHGGLEAIIGE